MHEYFSQRTRTSGTDETQALLNDRYGHVSVTSPRLLLVEEHAGDERFALGRVELTGGFEGAAELTDRFLVDRRVVGGGAWEVGRDSDVLTEQPVLFQPGRPLAAHMGDFETRTLMLERTALEATARAVYGDDRPVLEFDADPRPVHARAGREWSAALQLVDGLPGGLESDLVRASAYRLLAVSTLECFRLLGDREQRGLAAAALRRAHRRAVAFIDAHASLPITAVDVADAAGASLAQLATAFRAHSPVAPTAERYLQQTRLSAAHADLLAADPTRGDTVRAIAARWGFAHPGRFARLHRIAFGHDPKWVLDR